MQVDTTTVTMRPSLGIALLTILSHISLTTSRPGVFSWKSLLDRSSRKRGEYKRYTAWNPSQTTFTLSSSEEVQLDKIEDPTLRKLYGSMRVVMQDSSINQAIDMHAMSICPSFDEFMLDDYTYTILDNIRYKRKVRNRKSRLWPNGVIPYEFSTIHTYDDQDHAYQKIMEAIYIWNNNTCLRFVERGSVDVGHNNFITFRNGQGCSSFTGITTRLNQDGGQDVTLNETECLNVGVIGHELGHALGFYHEQSRSDREQYVTILSQNIEDGGLGAFNFFDTINNSPYDLESGMHYSLDLFAKDPEISTMSLAAKDLDFLPGSVLATGLTYYDFMAANLAYECEGSCPAVCELQGYPYRDSNNRCTCKCVPGLKGDTCNEIDIEYTKVPPCEDKDPLDCINRQFGGECNTNPDFMYKNCPWSCDLCANSAVTGEDCSQIIDLKNIGDTEEILAQYIFLQNCIWVIKAPPGGRVKLQFDDFHIDSSDNVCHHWLEIRYNLLAQTGPRYCGQGLPSPITALGSGHMMLKLDTARFGSFYINTGFKATVTALHKEAGPFTSIFCQGTKLLIDCNNRGDNNCIQIREATYGRTSDAVCVSSRGDFKSNTNCVQPGTTEIMKRECDGKTICSVPVENFVFAGDPCEGITKYVNITYSCL